jgi:hypothetical protein
MVGHGEGDDDLQPEHKPPLEIPPRKEKGEIARTHLAWAAPSPGAGVRIPSLVGHGSGDRQVRAGT